MSNENIRLIQKLIANSLQEGHTVLLHELLWTVDAQQHLIVTAEEINHALRECPPVRIERFERKIALIPSSDGTENKVTDADIADALKVYSEQVSQFITKSKSTKIKPRRSKHAS